MEGFDLEAALPLLSGQRREQCLKFKYEMGRKTCAAAYLLLCQALREEYGIKELPLFDYGEHGKPHLTGRPDIHFSLSHCRNGVLCAVSSQPVGADIESFRSYRESLVNYTMNDAEQQQIRMAERPDIEFVRLWTMKEAVLKRSGEGIQGRSMKDVLTGHETFETVVSMEHQCVHTVVW